MEEVVFPKCLLAFFTLLKRSFECVFLKVTAWQVSDYLLELCRQTNGWGRVAGSG